ncbi:MAG: hypothetical protein Kapaf2KO_20590 [Candidatus Kapaibacteriales bacterium]
MGLVMLLGLFAEDNTADDLQKMFVGFFFFGIILFVIGWLLNGKLRRDYKVMDEQRTQRNLLILAKKNKGNLTLSDTIIKLNLSKEKARKLLDDHVYNGMATLDMDEDGNTFYNFKDYK